LWSGHLARPDFAHDNSENSCGVGILPALIMQIESALAYFIITL
jgi:hypothetical protein